ncbi:MAG: carboxypeptidase M32 [Planctomycetes bacterium]|nr:carboxypeptidase M32 [Planctomycetota bacterium]NOG53796.1 carboxypeptidase M32 [Planctomycetota bacterium]
MNRQDAYSKLCAISKDVTVFSSIGSLLGWDQETMMPEGGTATRADQSAAMSGLVHEKATTAEIGDLLAVCEAEPFADDSVEAANVRELRHDYDRARKLPKAHVEEVARTQTIAQNEWAKARKESNFPHFAPHLEKILTLTRKSAEYYGWPESGEPYDALLEGYEPHTTSADIVAAFVPLREKLTRLIKDVQGAPKSPDGSIHTRTVPRDQQEQFVRFAAKAIGFNFDIGRLDISTHPFCSGIGPGDCRMTTRFHDDNVMDALSSTMHEAGHGIYEQNLNKEAWGTPCGESVSLGIHESQSRGWENTVGRSRAFWEWCLPHAKEIMPEAMADQTVDSVYEAQNIVKPSYIRVEADETTYNLHIMLRFEIERQMIRGEIDINDVPRIWNEKFKDYLGIEVDKDANGCLQDVHWSFGLMGYFPTYTLGNLYCAQFFEAAREAMPDMDDQFRRGEFTPLREWLTANIHAHGRRYPAGELCRRVTGKPLSADPLMRHLEGKIRPIYSI